MAGIVPMGDFVFPTPMDTTVCLCLAIERAGFFFSQPASQPAAHWIHTVSLKRPVLGLTLPLPVAMCSSCYRARAYVSECSLFPVSYK